MKKLFFLFLSCLLLSACMGEEVETEITLNETFLRENETLGFSFYLDRTEKTYYVKVSGTEGRELDSGTLCYDYSGSPVSCEVNLDEYQQPYLVKITYENGDFSFVELSVPVPEFMEAPEIVRPTEAPAQGSSFELSFMDTGASRYEVHVANCNEYKNDGISPCIDSESYWISMESGAPIFESSTNDYYLPSLTYADGIITVKSDFPIQYEETVGYTVTAEIERENGYGWMSDSASFE